MATTTKVFDGAMGRLVAVEMTRRNRAAESEAIERLTPRPTDHVLTIGFGPGVGLALLAAQVPEGRAIGVDPSAVMVQQANRRNRAAIALGVVELHRTTADALPCADASIDGAIAVNSVMLWEPFDASFADLARVLRPGARLVTITHDWALRKHFGSVDAFVATASETAARHALVDSVSEPARAEKGRAVVWSVTKQ
jgi:ubiquinone/menaquinone biosynthesis C-methylase UbiE